jgi:hypothetical protein
MRRVGAAAVLCALVLGAACRKREELKVQTEDAGDIPREVAMRRLRELLPTAETVGCTAPKDTYKAAEVKVWDVGADGLRVVPFKEKDATFAVKYSDLRQVKLEKAGRYFYVRLYSPAQADPLRDHLNFMWRAEEPAKQVVELIEALRQKK